MPYNHFRKIFLNCFDEIANKFQVLLGKTTKSRSRALQNCRNKDLSLVMECLTEEFHRLHLLDFLPSIATTLFELRILTGFTKICVTHSRLMRNNTQFSFNKLVDIA